MDGGLAKKKKKGRLQSFMEKILSLKERLDQFVLKRVLQRNETWSVSEEGCYLEKSSRIKKKEVLERIKKMK